MQYDIDTLNADELPLVFSSWLKANRAASAEKSDRAYYARQHDLVVDILADLPLVLVARNNGVALGWLCARPLEDGVCVDFAYTKSTYRKFGIASRLLSEALERLGDCSGDALLYSHRPAPPFDWLTTKLDDFGFECRPATLAVRLA